MACNLEKCCGLDACELDVTNDVVDLTPMEIVLDDIAEQVDSIACDVTAALGGVLEALEYYNGDQNPFMAPRITEEVAEQLASQFTSWAEQLESVLAGLRN
jgi:hypothetical protein